MMKHIPTPIRIGALVLALAMLLGCGLTSALPFGDDGKTSVVAVEEPAEDTETDEPAPAEDTTAPSDSADAPSADLAVEPGRLVFTDGPCYNPYFPIVNGRTLNYVIDSPTDPTFELATTFQSDSPDSFVMIQSFDEGTLESTWYCNESGLLRGDFAFVDLEELGQIAYADLEYEGATFPIPARFVEGATWQSIYRTTATIEAEGLSMSMDIVVVDDQTFVGYETITVPAGTFETARIDSVLTVSVGMGDAQMSTVEVTSTSWFAENIGLVQSNAGGFGYEDSLQQLVSVE